MKLTNEKQNTIIIKATSNSEWDKADFILLNINDEEWTTSILTAMTHCVHLDNIIRHFQRIVLSQNVDGWYIDDEENIDITNFLNQHEKDWSFIDISSEEIKELTCPEQSIQYDVMYVNSDNIYYKAFGKHTGEEFWTSEIPFREIINIK